MNQNKLIAEFMGLRKWCERSDLKYHTSWDWLMPVVQKCFYGTAVQVDDNKDNFFTINNSLPDMDETYKAVVDYIEGLSVKSVEADTKAVDDRHKSR
jgi:hypothetical protein